MDLFKAILIDRLLSLPDKNNCNILLAPKQGQSKCSVTNQISTSAIKMVSTFCTILPTE